MLPPHLPAERHASDSSSSSDPADASFSDGSSTFPTGGNTLEPEIAEGQYFIVDIARSTQANVLPSIGTRTPSGEPEKTLSTSDIIIEPTSELLLEGDDATMADGKPLKSSMSMRGPKRKPRENGAGGEKENGGLPLPVTAARSPGRERTTAPGGGGAPGLSPRTVRTSAPARPPLTVRVHQHWRAFMRQVQNAGSGSTPSGSITGGSGTADVSGSVAFVGRAHKIAGEVVARDMEEKRAAGQAKAQKGSKRPATGDSAQSKAGSLAHRLVRGISGGAGTGQNKSMTEATNSVRFRSVEGGDTDRGEDLDDEEERAPPKEHEMVVLDQGFSSSEGWTRRFAHLGASGFHPSAPSEDVPDGAHGGPGSNTYSVTGANAYAEHDDDHAASSAAAAGCWGATGLGVWLRWRVWPRFRNFYDMPFLHDKEEAAYQKEKWFAQKRTALLGSSFYMVYAALTCAFAPTPYDRLIMVTYFIIGLILAALLPFTIIYNWPRRLPFLYQSILWLASFGWCIYAVADMQYCHYFEHPNTCGGKDFTGVMYSAVSLPSVGMLGMGMHRFAHATGSLAFIIITSIVAASKSNNWIRNVLNFIFFSCAVQIVHWAKEKSDRRVWTLRDQLKKQFRATQKAQVAETKAADSKKRFTSYVFHEIRVPLNTALLALQNLQNSEVFGTSKTATTPGAGMPGGDAEDSEVEWHALLGSLVMMRKVLDDVLDYSRMDAGRFETVVAPFYFSRSLRSLVHSLNTAARSKGLDFVVDVDPKVDEVLLESAKAAARLMGDDDSTIHEGASMGDEMRLRQIVTNLCSNATKFTPPGGRVTLRTRLLFPAMPSSEPTPPSEIAAAPTLAVPTVSPASAPSGGQKLSRHHLQRQDQPGNVINTIVVRIEVEDTGLGISPQDLHDLRLFSPYVQTTLGRMQGGKGTGLGLALVRSIVRMSKGRLGVISTKGKGSQFWVELPLGCGQAAYQAQMPPAPTPEATLHPSGRVILTQRPSDTEAMLTRAEAAVEKGKELHGRISGDVSRDETPSPIKTLETPSTPDDGMSRFQLPIFTMTDSQPSTTSGQTRDSFISSPRPLLGRSDDSEQSIGTLQPAPREQTAQSQSTEVRQSPVNSTSTAVSDGSTAKPSGSAPPNLSRSQGATSASIPPLRILLVDDDALTRRLMSRMLTRQGHICSEAENGHEALVKLGAGVEDDDEAEPPKDEVEAAEHRFDLIMLDNFMPGRHSGVDVIRWLRRLGRRDFVTGCTANAEKGDQEEFMEAGLDDILTKPITQPGLMRICGLANTRRRQRQSQPTSA